MCRIECKVTQRPGCEGIKCCGFEGPGLVDVFHMDRGWPAPGLRGASSGRVQEETVTVIP